MIVRGANWTDDAGRRLVLRGLNLGGDSKVPARPDGATAHREGFFERKDLSFVGRPFPLDEADEHLGRIASWGMNFLRLVITWEAVEHEAPGRYDLEYLEYIEELAAKCGEHGLSLFIDPHQDVWSRWTGGDGAPIWTLEAAGLDPRSQHVSGAAMLHQEMGADYPQMVWFLNGLRLGCATMFSLFFGGNEFAPGIKAEGSDEPLQEFLQRSYIDAMCEIAKRLARFPHVVGFDSLNEPSPGFIGVDDLASPSDPFRAPGIVPTPWEAIRAGSGFPVEVKEYTIRGLGISRVGKRILGSEGVSAWLEGRDCLWRRLGVWEVEDGRPVLLKPEHFSTVGGRRLDFATDFLRPFVLRFGREIRASAEQAKRFTIFIEGVPGSARLKWGREDPFPVVDATHWYDDLTLATKRWSGLLAFDAREKKVILGPRKVRRYFSQALASLKSWASENMSGAPSLLGEFGLPFDLNKRLAYRRREEGSGKEYLLHEKVLAKYYDAVDSNLMDSTLWNYSARNGRGLGDLWNNEDLSVYCHDEALAKRSETGNPIDIGGRALRGFVRPYARAVAGELLSMSFVLKSGRFELVWRPDHRLGVPTEVFVPALQYPAGFEVDAEGARLETREDKTLILAFAVPGSDLARLLIARS